MTLNEEEEKVFKKILGKEKNKLLDKKKKKNLFKKRSIRCTQHPDSSNYLS
jgi:hypothetical protein